MKTFFILIFKIRNSNCANRLRPNEEQTPNNQEMKQRRTPDAESNDDGSMTDDSTDNRARRRSPFSLSPFIHPFAFAFAFAIAIVRRRSRWPFSIGPVARPFAVDFSVAVSPLPSPSPSPVPFLAFVIAFTFTFLGLSSPPPSQSPSLSHLTSPGLHSLPSPPPAVAWPSSWPLLAPYPGFTPAALAVAILWPSFAPPPFCRLPWPSSAVVIA